MGRKVLAVFAAFVVFLIIVTVVEFAAHLIYPAPAGLDLTNKDDLAKFVRQAPTIAKLLVIFAHVLGALAAGFVISLINKSRKTKSLWILGGIFTLFATANLIMVPGHPVWFWILDLVVYIPCVLLGSNIWERTRSGSGDHR